MLHENEELPLTASDLLSNVFFVVVDVVYITTNHPHVEVRRISQENKLYVLLQRSIALRGVKSNIVYQYNFREDFV